MRYAEVILGRAAARIDKIFHYAIPPELEDKIQIGDQLAIPFGKTKAIGYCLGFTNHADVAKVKEITAITSPFPLFDAAMVQTVKWLSDYYLCFLNSAFRAILPPGITTLKGGMAGKRSPAPTLGIISIRNKVSGSTTQKPLLISGNDTTKRYEFYLGKITETINQDQTVLVLMPDILSSPTLLKMIENKFPGKTGIYHSGLSAKERYQHWLDTLQGKYSIVIGTRSAVFSPLPNLGLVIIDEEHEATYKQEKNPRYHAREVALFRAQLAGAQMLLGSGAPSLESYYQAQQGNYTQLNLDEEKNRTQITIIDMKKEYSSVSKQLGSAIKEVLQNNGKVLLIVNRRGFSPYLICTACGKSINCPQCAVSLVYHESDKQLHCHHCGYTLPPQVVCPHCKESAVKFSGVGTQKVESEIKRLVPSANVRRMDADVPDYEKELLPTLQAFRDGEFNLLLGTRMVAKVLEMTAVDLVGIISADSFFRISDFRASEHAYQFFAELTGRAGGNRAPEKLLVQSYHLDHPVLQALQEQGLEQFYVRELSLRGKLSYPPFSHLISILFQGDNEPETEKTAQNLKEFIALGLQGEKAQILGPAPALVAKRRGHFRFELLLKAPDTDKLKKIVKESINKIEWGQNISLTVDVDPLRIN